MKKTLYRNLLKELLALGLIVQLSFLSISPYVTAKQTVQDKTDTLQELNLLRGEHFLYVNATKDVTSFHIRYSFPPDYNYQVPIMLEILNDSTADVLNYEIQKDSLEPNNVINFTLGSMQKGDMVFLHFLCWVLVINNNYSDLPEYAKIPKKCELPEETKYWLSSSDVVQTNSILLKIKAYEVKGFTTNLFVLAHKIAFYVKYHKLPFYSLQLALGTLKGQDALTTLFRNGDCPGRSHLSCALFRINNVPARVVMVTRSYPFWYQMHFMVEYYCPNYGWILSEVHNAETPYEPKNQIVMRICSLEDENTTGHDFIFSKMTGVEQWFWIDDNAVKPYYKDLKEGSKLNMFPEKALFTNTTTAFTTINVTETVFSFYQQYLGKNLSEENLNHFRSAVVDQKQAIESFKQSEDPYGYIDYMTLALNEYGEISE
jgi:hypothetical protein